MQEHFFNRYVELDPFLDVAQARSLVQLCQDFGNFVGCVAQGVHIVAEDFHGQIGAYAGKKTFCSARSARRPGAP